MARFKLQQKNRAKQGEFMQNTPGTKTCGVHSR